MSALSSAWRWVVFGGVVIAYLAQLGSAICYLADEYQGVFMGLLPSTPTNPAQVAEVMVVADGIPLWGECYRKLGSSIILRERERSQCFRCMVIHVRSNNVLQVYTEGLEKCFLDEESARVTCPTEASISSKDAKEIMLYKRPNPEVVVIQSYCPINGRFKFTYSAAGGLRECRQQTSELSNCPYGFSMTSKFKQCSFPDEEMHYQCLGDWEGPNDERYLALLEGKPNLPLPPSAEPKYRCAIYKEDKGSGRIDLALSADSTCTNRLLLNSTNGFETYKLSPVMPPIWPSLVLEQECRFPEWSQGSWTHLTIEGGLLMFRDHRNFKTHTIKCMGKDNKSRQDRFRVFARSQCGDEVYICITLAQRSDHVLEFQIGQYPDVRYNDSICDGDQFSPKSWITLGKKGNVPDTPCPISGEYTGIIPDTQGICGKLSSDCNNPNIMFYTASNCMNRSEVYDEREYKCLGQWTEDGLTYTYTERRDVHGFQCFVGKIINSLEVSIMEADVNCMRGIDLVKFGMSMMKQDTILAGDCDTGGPLPRTSNAPPTLPEYVPSRPTPGRSSSTSSPSSTVRTSTHNSVRPWQPSSRPPMHDRPLSTSTQRVFTASNDSPAVPASSPAIRSRMAPLIAILVAVIIFI